MEIWINVLKVILLVISFIGHTIFINRKFKIRFEFAPILIVAGIAIIEFVSGILNMMSYANILILVFGIALFVYSIMHILKNNTKKEILKMLLNPSLIIILILFVYFVLISSKLHLMQNDNFTHWLVVVEDMLESNKLPNFESTTVLYKSYPLGSAFFIYYFCYFAGSFEACMIIAQSIIFLSGMCTLFAFVDNTKKKNWIYYIVIVAFILVCSVSNMSFKELLVDNLLASTGLAAVCILIYNYKDLKKLTILSSILSVFLIMLKNSGIYFFAINVLILIARIIKGIKEGEYSKKECTQYLLIGILLPLITMFVWKRHLAYAYGSEAGLGYHSMSIKSYGGNILSMNMNDFKKIVAVYIDTIFDWNNIVTKSIVIINVLFIIYILSTKVLTKSWRKDVIKTFLISDLIYIAYQLGTFGMYIFSMPVVEALYLAGYTRYLLTIIHFILGIFVLSTIRDIQKINDTKKVVIFSYVFSCILVSLFVVGIFNTKYNKFNLIGIDKTYKDSYKEMFDNLKQKHEFPKDKAYAICYFGVNLETMYVKNIIRYSLGTFDINMINQLDEYNVKYLNKCDYIIILGDKTPIQDILTRREKEIVVIDAASK